MSDLTINFQKAGEEVVIGALRRVGEVAINALGAAFSQVAAFAADSFKGAIEAQAGIDRLTGSIVRLGDKSPVSIEQAFDLAEQFKNLVGGSDDVVLAMQDVILRFDKISSDTFPRVIEQSADLAVALKTDPTRAAELLGKVLQDLGTDGVGSIGRLKAAGVALTEEQEKQIKSLVEAGKVTEAQTVLLDALAETTGGKAAQNAGTLAGQWDIFKETIADAGEGIAMKFLPPLTELAETWLPIVTSAITDTAGAISGFIEGILGGDIEEAIDTMGEWDFVRGIIQGLGIDLYSFSGAVDDLVTIAKEKFASFADDAKTQFNNFLVALQPLIAAVQNVVAAFMESMPIIQATIADMVAFAQAQFAALAPTIIANMQGILDQVVIILNNLAAFWREHGDEIMAIVDIAWRFIVGTVGAAVAIFSGLIKALLQGINGDWEGAWATMLGSLGAFFDSALSIVGTNLDSFIESWQGTFSLAEQIVSTVFDNIVSGIRGKVAELAAAALSAAMAAINAIRDAFGMHSPSTFGIGVGKNLMESMAAGILGGVGQPVGAMRAASSAVSNSVNNNGGNTYNYYGVQADMQAAYARSLAGAF